MLCGFDFGRSPRKCIEWGQAALITPTEPGNPKIAFAKHSNSFFWTFAAFWQAQCDSVCSPLKRMVEPSHAFPALRLWSVFLLHFLVLFGFYSPPFLALLLLDSCSCCSWPWKAVQNVREAKASGSGPGTTSLTNSTSRGLCPTWNTYPIFKSLWVGEPCEELCRRWPVCKSWVGLQEQGLSFCFLFSQLQRCSVASWAPVF